MTKATIALMAAEQSVSDRALARSRTNATTVGYSDAKPHVGPDDPTELSEAGGRTDYEITHDPLRSHITRAVEFQNAALVDMNDTIESFRCELMKVAGATNGIRSDVTKLSTEMSALRDVVQSHSALISDLDAAVLEVAKAQEWGWVRGLLLVMMFLLQAVTVYQLLSM